MVDVDYIIDFLSRIIAVPSPTGYTDEALDLVTEEARRLLPGGRITRLKKGAVTVRIPGQREETLVLDAHVDTLGAMVKEIKSDGRLTLTPIGGKKRYSHRDYPLQLPVCACL